MPEQKYKFRPNMRMSIQKIYILSVVALDETIISGSLHFSMQNIELSCDLDRTSRRRNINVSQWHFLFIDVCVTSFTYGHDVMFTGFTPWLFQYVRYIWNILFYKDNWCGWVEENSVNSIDYIESKYKDWNSYFKLALDDEKWEVH